MGQSDSVRVAVAGDTAFVRIGGRGSFKTAPALKQFAARAVGSGKARQMVFDMLDCVGMDSTFMGVIAGIAMRLRRECSGRVVAINLSAKTAGLLDTLGLTQLVATHLAGPPSEPWTRVLPASGGLAALDTGTEDRRASLDTMLRAHQDLVQAAPSNLARFEDVIEYLRKDVAEQNGTPPGPQK